MSERAGAYLAARRAEEESIREWRRTAVGALEALKAAAAAGGLPASAVPLCTEALVAGDPGAWGGARGYFRPASAAAFAELPLREFGVRASEQFIGRARQALGGLRAALEAWGSEWAERNRAAERAWEAASRGVVEAKAAYEAGLAEVHAAEQDAAAAGAASAACAKNLKTDVKGYATLYADTKLGCVAACGVWRVCLRLASQLQRPRSLSTPRSRVRTATHTHTPNPHNTQTHNTPTRASSQQHSLQHPRGAHAGEAGGGLRAARRVRGEAARGAGGQCQRQRWRRRRERRRWRWGVQGGGGGARCARWRARAGAQRAPA